MFKRFKRKVEPTLLYSPCNGIIKDIRSLDDGVFSNLVLGQGYYIEPVDGNIHSPVVGKVMSIFPTKHAIGIKTENGEDVLLHMGVDTVELEGKPFEIFVKEGDALDFKTLIAKIDLEFLKDHDIGNEIITVFPDSDKSIDLDIVESKTYVNALVGRVKD